MHVVTLFCDLLLEIYSMSACEREWVGMDDDGRILISRISHAKSNVFNTQEEKSSYFT